MKRTFSAIGCIAFALMAAPAQALDTYVESFDGTDINTHFYVADGLEPGERAPTLLIGHGWGLFGDSRTGTPKSFLAAGYNVITWDARGFGQSGGTAMIDHPDFEARDVSALLDFLASQPEAQLDRPGDPRVGMSGGSYGGAIQLVSAAHDKRIDVIAPTIAWHNLMESLYTRASPRVGWNLALIGIGVPSSAVLGVFNPNGIETGHQAPQFYNSVIGGAATGMIPEAEQAWFNQHGSDIFLRKIKIPVLIAEGTVDTLFNLDQAHHNYQGLRQNGTPLKMMWFCGGHGYCNVPSDGGPILGDSAHVQMRRLEWFDRYLRGNRKAKVGPAFEWIDQAGEWHSSKAYPLKAKGSLDGSGGGTIPLVPGINPTSGELFVASPDPLAPIKVPIAAQGGEEVVGAPRLKFTYTATGTTTTRTDGLAHIYGQVVDSELGLVVGNQSTPIPLKLDGQEHSIKTTLTRIANVASSSGFELQLIGQSNLFDGQRAAGAVTIEGLKVKLPITAPRKRVAPGRHCGAKLKGDGNANTLIGTAASERIRGAGGDDRAKGRGADDCIGGGNGRDRLAGGPGDDRVQGGAGRDWIKGGPGNDVIVASDPSRDVIDCGPGRDWAKVFRGERTRRCERVTRRGRP